MHCRKQKEDGIQAIASRVSLLPRSTPHLSDTLFADMPKSLKTLSMLSLLLFKNFTQWSAMASRGIWGSQR